MNFEFATAQRIIFGEGALEQAAPAAAQVGTRALVVTGKTVARAQPLLDRLGKVGLASMTYPVGDEPTVDAALTGVEQARAAGCDLVIAFGGGSVIDCAKAIAALLANPGDPYDYLEVIGRALPLPNLPIPCFAIPTTAGTGSEVTRNAVLSSPQHRVKVSLRSLSMIPRLAIVDPLLTLSMPPAVTASTGLDALTQLIEPFVSSKATSMTDAVCREALPRAATALRRAYDQGDDLAARTDMAFASLCGGIALANAGLGAVHGIAGPLGGTFHAPHGAICAALLAPITEVNLFALRERAPEHRALARYAEIARICCGRADATTADLVLWLRELAADLAIPSLSEYGLSEPDLDTLVPKVLASSSMKGNPLSLHEAELRRAILQAM